MTRQPSRSDLAGSRYLALQRHARSEGRPAGELMQRYVLEGFLRRLTCSSYADRLVLKGGLLLAAFDIRRATRDVDLLGLRINRSPQACQSIVEEIVSIDLNDGVVFQPHTLKATSTRNDDLYSGVRVTSHATLARAQSKLSVDINVGDPVSPNPIRTRLPTLMDGEPLEVLAYPKGMVVAEKLVTALERGRANTRWRDFADLYLLSCGELDATEVGAALHVVADHRGIVLRPLGEALSEMGNQAQRPWTTWLMRHGPPDVPKRFATLLDIIDERSRLWLAEALKGSF